MYYFININEASETKALELIVAILYHNSKKADKHQLYIMANKFSRKSIFDKIRIQCNKYFLYHPEFQNYIEQHLPKLAINIFSCDDYLYELFTKNTIQPEFTQFIYAKNQKKDFVVVDTRNDVIQYAKQMGASSIFVNQHYTSSEKNIDSSKNQQVASLPNREDEHPIKKSKLEQIDEPSQFENLADEIILKIFLFLDTKSLLTISLVCSLFNHVSNSPELWTNKINIFLKENSKNNKSQLISQYANQNTKFQFFNIQKHIFHRLSVIREVLTNKFKLDDAILLTSRGQIQINTAYNLIYDYEDNLKIYDNFFNSLMNGVDPAMVVDFIIATNLINTKFMDNQSNVLHFIICSLNKSAIQKLLNTNIDLAYEENADTNTPITILCEKLLHTEFTQNETDDVVDLLHTVFVKHQLNNSCVSENDFSTLADTLLNFLDYHISEKMIELLAYIAVVFNNESFNNDVDNHINQHTNSDMHFKLYNNEKIKFESMSHNNRLSF